MPANVGSTLAVIVGGGAGVLLLFLSIFILWSRRRRRRSFDLDLEDPNYGGLSVKSAPSSRHPSPRPEKRLSCPDALRMPMRGGVVVSGVPADLGVPDYSLPTERVQPRSSGHSEGHCAQGDGDPSYMTTLHCQHDLIADLDPGMHSRSGSLTEDEDVFLPRSSCGRLWYSLTYDPTVEHLNVTLIKVKDLPGRGSHNQPRDPYVKVFVLPDDRACRTSKVRKKTMSPVFNESFLFQVPADELKKRVVRFSVYDVDKRKMRHSLGHVMVPLCDVDLDHEDTYWSDLETSTQLTSCLLGDVHLSLCYQPQHEKLKVNVLRVRHFKHTDMDTQSRLYMRLQLFYGRKLHRTKRTGSRHAWGHEEVELNEAVSFSMAGKQLDSCRLELALMVTPNPQPQGVKTDQEVECGRVVLGPFMYARGEQLQHWQAMLAQTRHTITRWHALSAPIDRS
ncbi:hypothetical protein ACOMHN_002077 [Nucella lapillus]